MFLGCRMVHQQVDLALSQFPKGLAAELASDEAPRLCGSHKQAPLGTGDHAKWGLISIHSTAEEIAKIGRSAADSRGARKQRSRR